MTLEHIYNPVELLTIVRRSIGDRENTLVFLQVPNMTRILKNYAFEDIYYEHCSYFSAGSLARLVRSCHFDILDLKHAYDEQYVLMEAKPSSYETAARLPLEDDLPLLKKYINCFKAFCPVALKYWQNKLDEIKTAGHRAVVWGSGSKGVSFLNTLPNADFIEYVIDINPHRQGTYMAATGQKIVAPNYLKTYCPDVVIVMNAIYEEEIRKDLKEMELEPLILGLGKNSYLGAGHE
jgi:hypothetical protein